MVVFIELDECVMFERVFVCVLACVFADVSVCVRVSLEIFVDDNLLTLKIREVNT